MSKEKSLWQKFLGGIKLVTNSLRILTNLIFLSLFVIAIGSLTSALTANKPPPLDEKTALLIVPEGVLVDQKTYVEPLAEILNQGVAGHAETLVRDVIRAIDSASQDPRITHLILDLNYLEGGGVSKLVEVGYALKRFQKSDKPIIAYADYLFQHDYYLAAHADEIIINRLGLVEISGFAAYRNYFKDAIDKLQVSVNVLRVGEHKSAVEPYIKNMMSEEVREETSRWIGSLWDFYSKEMEILRELPEGTIETNINNMHARLVDAKGDFATMALDAGLVDRLASRTELSKYLNELESDAEGQLRSIDLSDYLSHVDNETVLNRNLTQKKIAIVVAKGSMFNGEQPEGSIGGDTLAKIFQEVSNDSNVAAVVLRIDSGGGSYFASEIIRDAISETRNTLPVVVSMGSVAASGGYYIAAEADHVLAMPTTITGSIGIYSIIPTFERSLDSLGITTDGVGTTWLAGSMRADRALPEKVKDLMQINLQHEYSEFITLVANGRNLEVKAVEELAGGKVWTGIEALELGLIDEIGDLGDAIEIAAKLAKIDSYQLDFRQRPTNFFEKLALQLSTSFLSELRLLPLQIELDSGTQGALINGLQSMRLLQNLDDPGGIYMYCAECLL